MLMQEDHYLCFSVILELLTSQPPKDDDGTSLVEQELEVVWEDNDKKYIQVKKQYSGLSINWTTNDYPKQVNSAANSSYRSCL